jgi:transposase
MLIIGCDYHPGFQQIACVDTGTGELQERRLEHRQEAERFYRDLKERGVNVRVGMEASGQARWFERLLSELQVELWVTTFLTCAVAMFRGPPASCKLLKLLIFFGS